MLRVLFQDLYLRSRIQAGLNTGRTIEGSDWIKTTMGKVKTLQPQEERKKTRSHLHRKYMVWSPEASPRPPGRLSVNRTPLQDVRPPGLGGVLRLPLQDVG